MNFPPPEYLIFFMNAQAYKLVGDKSSEAFARIGLEDIVIDEHFTNSQHLIRSRFVHTAHK